MSDLVVISPGERVALDPASPAFAHGFGLFETIRVADGRIIFWAEHWARLRASARAFDLDCTVSEEEALAAAKALCRAAKSPVALKLSLLSEGERTRLYLYLRPASRWPERVSLRWTADGRLDPSCPLAGHKTHNYMANLRLLQRSRKAGYDDVLRRTTDGRLGETAVSNFFLWEGGVLRTPDLSCGILPGVVREAVMGVAKERGMEVSTGDLGPEDLARCELAFVTNSSCGIRPVSAIRGEGLDLSFKTFLKSNSGNENHPALRAPLLGKEGSFEKADICEKRSEHAALGALAELQEGLAAAEELSSVGIDQE